MNNKAFTLVELLAVIVILGILVTVTVSSITGILRESKDKGYELLLVDIENATKDYLDDNKSILEGLTNSSPSVSINLSTLLDGGYLESPIENPKTNRTIDEMSTVVATLQSDGNISYTFNLTDQ